MSNGHTALATREHDNGEIAIPEELVAVRPSMLEAIARVEIDSQIATAKRYPRSLAQFKREAESLIAYDADLAAECSYVLPGRGDGGKKITGPSVRLAEIMMTAWGNLQVSTHILGDDGRYITIQGQGRDLEKNNAFGLEVQRGITTKDGRRFGNDMIRVTAMAGQAIAKRNVILGLIPRAIANRLEDFARTVAKGDVKTLPERTQAALDWFATKGIEASRVFAAIGIKGLEDMTLDLIIDLSGLRTALKEGHVAVDEMFPPIAGKVASAVSTALADRITKNTGAAPASPAPTPPPPETVPEPASAPEPIPAPVPLENVIAADESMMGWLGAGEDPRAFTAIVIDGVKSLNASVAAMAESNQLKVLEPWLAKSQEVNRAVYLRGIDEEFLEGPAPQLPGEITKRLTVLYGEHRAWVRLAVQELLEKRLDEATVAIEKRKGEA